jgi:hypothetical protein
MSQFEDSVLEQPEGAEAAPAREKTAVAGRIYGAVGEFDTPEALLAGIRGARDGGYRKLEAYTPFPVHGIDAALGGKRSKLGYLVLGGGFAGAAAALLMIWYTGAVDYPLVIAGKPLFALEFSIPITFELTVLFAAFAAVLGMLAINGLPRLYHPVFQHSRYSGATNDKFLLAIEADSAGFDGERAAVVLESLGARHVEVIAE